MTTPSGVRTRSALLSTSLVAAAALAVLPVGSAFAASSATAAHAAASIAPASANTPSSAEAATALLASTAWETTAARDQDGNAMALTDPAVANFVGWAYYDAAGTFRIYSLEDAPRSQGEWSLATGPEGLTRTLVAKNAAGDVLFSPAPFRSLS
ncbi:lipoprotein LpqB [Leifsonia xyli subsp. cynodontis DSM 46306]|uniref:DUF4822 domain-containing protein n=1 Tax=Leifsonia xyli subsp. cynodontis DSM 46306 TaxID=1389489 RepID=U3PBH1_LEIXC|nr:DUF4822 domain-containing protein [Leifsonia xyli]AGW42092.1 lipoprotein LpqB [Leifsonia xyli subsp. cynodontis DSM 46306]